MPEILAAVLAALGQLAGGGSGSVGSAIGRLEQLLAHAGAADFAAWVSGRLARKWRPRMRRRALFALDDPLSVQLFAVGRTSDDFARLEKRLAATTLALVEPESRASASLPLHRHSVPAHLARCRLHRPPRRPFPGFAGEGADADLSRGGGGMPARIIAHSPSAFWSGD